MGRYEVGNLIRVSAEFTDPNNDDAETDPTSVYLTVKSPSGTVVEYTYGVGSDITKASTGNYYADVDADEPGRWWYRWYSTGTGQAAKEGSFIADPIDTQ